MAGIQFIGSDAVITAYKNRKVKVWAIFSGRALNCAGSDEESLSDYLQMIAPASGTTTYTLKVYADLESEDDVFDKSPSNGEFNFKLEGVAMSGPGRAVGPASSVDIITQKINARIGAIVEKELDRVFAGKADEDEDEEEETLQSMLMGLLKNPQQLIGLINVGKQLFGGPVAPVATALGKVEPVIMGKAVSNTRYVPDESQIPAPGVNNQNQDAGTNAQEIHERLTSAINRLDSCDPNFLAHLEKLADVAEKNPQMYKMAINMLNTL